MFLKIAPALVLLLQLTSCIGYAVVASGKPSEPYSNCPGGNTCTYVKDQIKKAYGKPDHIKVENGKEYWMYDSHLAFRGVLLGLVVPIPLLIPAGYDKTIFVFENEIFSHIVIENSDTISAFLCGLIPAGHGTSFGCYVR